MLKLEIEKKHSPLNNITLYEKIDPEILNGLIHSEDLKDDMLSGLYKPKNDYYNNLLHQLGEYKKEYKPRKKLFSVSYKKTTWYGRVYPKKSLCLASMPKNIRSSLTNNLYIDLDIRTAQISILYNICNNNDIETPNIKKYIDDRDNITDRLACLYNIHKKKIKELFNRMTMGGSYKKWYLEHEIKEEYDPDIINFSNEINCIISTLKEHNEILYNDIKTKKKEKKTRELDRSFMASYLQHKENEILEHMVYFLKDEIKICPDNVLTLIFDGLLLLKEPVEKYGGIEKLICELTEYITSTTGYKLVFSVKPLEPYYDIEPDKKTIEPLPPLDNAYEVVKEEFEKYNFKIKNKGLYGTITKTGELLLSKKSKLEDIYEHIVYNDYNRFKVLTEYTFIKKWIKDPTIRLYEDMGIYPDEKLMPENYYNLWIPFEMENIKNYKHHQEGLDFMLNHIKILCGNIETSYNYFIRWIGQLIKYPTIKTIMPTFISDEGSGKGSFVNLIRKMLGNNKVFETTTPSRDVWGNFNSAMMSAYFVVLNETEKKQVNGNIGQLKGLITDQYLNINQKGKDTCQVLSYHRFLNITNRQDAGIYTTKGDRRNFINRSSDILKGDKLYFEKFNEYLDNVDIIKSCYEYFKGLENLDRFNREEIPTTEYQEELKQLTISPIEKWVEYETRSYLNEKSGELIDNNIMEYTCTEAYNNFKKWAVNNGVMDTSGTKYNITSIQFAVRLSNLRINGVSKYRNSKERGYILQINDLKEYYKI